MHTVIMQGLDGSQLQALLVCAQAVGVGRVAFPGHEYKSGSGNAKADESPTVAILDRRRPRNSGPLAPSAAQLVEDAARRWGFADCVQRPDPNRRT